MKMLPLLVLVLILVNGEALVSSAESVNLNVLVGHPVRLPVTFHGDRSNVIVRAMKWIHNSENVVFYRPNQDAIIPDKYKHQVDFSTEDYSLTLKNPQKSDKTEYEAEIDYKQYGSGVLTSTTTYQLSYYEHAAVPILSVLSNHSIPDFCHVALNCTGPEKSVTSSCFRTSPTNRTFCCQEGGGNLLSISFSQSSVSCNHSNPVSWSLDTIELQTLCPFYGGGPSPLIGLSPCQLKAMVLSIILVAMTSVVISIHVREKLCKKD